MAYAAEDLRQHGIAVWNIEYRRLGEPGGGYPGSFADIANGIDRLRKLAKTYWLNLIVVAAGHSAGGHLALWAAARPRLPKTSPLYLRNPLPIRRVVSLVTDRAIAKMSLPLIGAHPRRIVPKPAQAHEPEVTVEVLEWVALRACACDQGEGARS